jgi:hypothetical protein
MRSLLLGVITFVSLSAQAEVLFTQICRNQTSEFTVAVYFEDIPGSRIATNVILAETAIKPDQTTVRISYDEATAEDRVFNDTEKALKYFGSTNVKLTNRRGKKFIYSGKNKTLTRIEVGSAPINCRDVSLLDVIP